MRYPSSPGLVGGGGKGGGGEGEIRDFFPRCSTLLSLYGTLWEISFFEFFCNATCLLHLLLLPPTQISEFSSLPFPFRISLSLSLWLSVIVACKGGTFSSPSSFLEQCWVDSTPPSPPAERPPLPLYCSLSKAKERRRREGARKTSKFPLFFCLSFVPFVSPVYLCRKIFRRNQDRLY